MTRSRRKKVVYGLADYQDLPELVELCYMFQKESWQAFADFDDYKVENYFISLMEGDNSEIFVAHRGGYVVGCICVFLYNPPHSNTLFAGDYIWYVVPEERGSMIGVRLMKMFMDWAESNGAKCITTGASSAISTDRTSELFKHLGCEVTGTAIIRRF